MGAEYGPAIDMWMPDWVFTDALVNLSGEDLSIVEHKTACGGFCSATDIAQYFIDGSGGAHKSVHFVVGRDGSVIQCVHLKDGAGGNCCLEAGHDPFWDPYARRFGNLNTCTISIEHEDWTADNSQAMTQAQIDASFALNLWLVQKFHIPPSHIKGHDTLDPVSRARCPGPTYPMSQLIAFVEAHMQPTLEGEPLAAFTALWNSIVPGLRMDTGIADYIKSLFAAGSWGNMPGAPTGPEHPYTNGRVFQNFQTGFVIWDGQPHLFTYRR